MGISLGSRDPSDNTSFVVLAPLTFPAAAAAAEALPHNLAEHQQVRMSQLAGDFIGD